MSERFDYYEELEVTKTASNEEIVSSYKRLARKHHPDKNPNNKEVAEDKFKRVGKAYAILSDPSKRKKYDLMGHDGVDGLDNQFDASEIFNQVFQGMGGMGGLFDVLGGLSRMGGMRNPFMDEDSYIKSPPKQIPLNLTTQQLYNGKNITINYNRKNKCSTCDGNGIKDKNDMITCDMCKGNGMITITRQMGPFMQQITKQCDCEGGKVIKPGSECKDCKGGKMEEESMRLILKIPPGTGSGYEYRFTGKADWNPRFMEPGDLIFIIKDSGDNFFKREGCNLLIMRDISLKQALIGFKFRVCHMDGRVLELVSNDIIRPDEIMKIVGEGMPKGPNESGKGDLIIRFNIIFPSHLNKNREDYLSKVLPDIKLSKMDSKLESESKCVVKKLKPYVMSESAHLNNVSDNDGFY